MFPPSHLSLLLLLLLLLLLPHLPPTLAIPRHYTRQILHPTLAIPRHYNRQIRPHTPAVQSLTHCTTAAALIPSTFPVARISAGEFSATSFCSQSCLIFVTSTVVRSPGAPPFPESPPLNTGVIHNEIWPRVKQLAGENVDAVLLSGSKVGVWENVDLGGGWRLSWSFTIQGSRLGLGGFPMVNRYRISMG
ncbi:hypothetical protein MMC30_004179 [Trapelia coarctata]|nr:hypothetical protein [Trapelia coarctata]